MAQNTHISPVAALHSAALSFNFHSLVTAVTSILLFLLTIVN